MKSYFKVFGLAFGITLAPMAVFAQSLDQADSSPNGALASPDSNASGINANPFTGAAGADKFYQNNSLSGASQPDNSAASGSGTGMSTSTTDNPAPTDSGATDTNANPFAGAAGADRFYKDNSLTDATLPSSAGVLGGGLGVSAQSWATTP